MNARLFGAVLLLTACFGCALTKTPGKLNAAIDSTKVTIEQLHTDLGKLEGSIDKLDAVLSSSLETTTSINENLPEVIAMLPGTITNISTASTSVKAAADNVKALSLKIDKSIGNVPDGGIVKDIKKGIYWGVTGLLLIVSVVATTISIRILKRARRAMPQDIFDDMTAAIPTKTLRGLAHTITKQKTDD